MSLLLLVVVILFQFSQASKGLPGNCNGGNDTITSLYGYKVGGNNPPLKMNSGYIQVNKTANGSLFYWLIQSMAAKVTTETPLLIWINGGPGASSLTGMFAGNGYILSSLCLN